MQERAARPPVYPALTAPRGITIGGPRPTTDQCRRCGRYHGTTLCQVPPVSCFRCGRPGHISRFCTEIIEVAPQKGKEPEGAPVETTAPRRRATAEEKGKQAVGVSRGRVHALDQDTAGIDRCD